MGVGGTRIVYCDMVLALSSKAIAHQWLLFCVGESVGFSRNNYEKVKLFQQDVVNGRCVEQAGYLRGLIGGWAKLSDEVCGCNVHAGAECGGCAEFCAFWDNKLV